MQLDFSGRVAIVTGGGSGVGREIARLVCGGGGSVAVVDIDPEKAGETVALLEGSGGGAAAYRADVTNGEDVRKMVEEVLKQFGQVDILFNNAGYGIFKKFKDTTPQDWSLDLGVNLYGPLHCTRAVINHMIGRKYGKIVNTVSDAGRVGEPNLAVYSAAKAGAIGLAKALAKEVGQYGINVNCVALGTTRTPLVAGLLTPEYEEKMIRAYPLKRLGLPHEPAQAAVFLASDQASWITGQVLAVNGGYSCV